MKLLCFLLPMILYSSCASEKPLFVKENVCSNKSLKYLNNPRNKSKNKLSNKKIIEDVFESSHKMQTCYVEFRKRSGHEEFSACLVVGVDVKGMIEFYNMDSKELELDDEFLNCANKIAKNLPYQDYGRNYVLIQVYKFYINENY